MLGWVLGGLKDLVPPWHRASPGGWGLSGGPDPRAQLRTKFLRAPWGSSWCHLAWEQPSSGSTRGIRVGCGDPRVAWNTSGAGGCGDTPRQGAPVVRGTRGCQARGQGWERVGAGSTGSPRGEEHAWAWGHHGAAWGHHGAARGHHGAASSRGTSRGHLGAAPRGGPPGARAGRGHAWGRGRTGVGTWGGARCARGGAARAAIGCGGADVTAGAAINSAAPEGRGAVGRARRGAAGRERGAPGRSAHSTATHRTPAPSPSRTCCPL